MSKPKRTKKDITPGRDSGGKHPSKAARVAVTTTRRVFSVAAHERSILIGPNGSTLHKLLAMHDVRMSLSRCGKVTIQGQEERVALAVAHIARLLRHTKPAAPQYMAAAHDSVRQGHTFRSRKCLPATLTPPPGNSHVPSLKVWTENEMLRTLGRRLGETLKRILDFVANLPRR